MCYSIFGLGARCKGMSGRFVSIIKVHRITDSIDIGYIFENVLHKIGMHRALLITGQTSFQMNKLTGTMWA